MKFLFSGIFIFLCVFAASAQTKEPSLPESQCKIIRIVPLPLSKKVPPKIKPVPKIALLDICPDNYGMMQRPVIGVRINGKKMWREFDVVKTFRNRAEAKAYAKTNKIKDVKFTTE